MSRRVLLLAVLGGCDRLFDLDHLAETTDAGFDPAVECAQYFEPVPGSRYRVVTASSPAVASDTCAADVPGRTHLAVVDSAAELSTIRAELDVRNAGRWLLGAVQLPTAATPSEGWIWVTGEPVDPALWGTTTSGPQPNDIDNDESDHAEQFVVVREDIAGVIDESGILGDAALCECDGRAMTGEATAAIVENSR